MQHGAFMMDGKMFMAIPKDLNKDLTEIVDGREEFILNNCQFFNVGLLMKTGKIDIQKTTYVQIVKSTTKTVDDGFISCDGDVSPREMPKRFEQILEIASLLAATIWPPVGFDFHNEAH